MLLAVLERGGLDGWMGWVVAELESKGFSDLIWRL